MLWLLMGCFACVLVTLHTTAYGKGPFTARLSPSDVFHAPVECCYAYCSTCYSIRVTTGGNSDGYHDGVVQHAGLPWLCTKKSEV
jgi:streptolysin S family bacteriocin protoxin